MKIVASTLSITLTVNCPNCDQYIDLINDTISSKFESNINDCGEITEKAVGSIDWEKSHKEFDENILCTECNKEFNVKTIDW